MQDLTTPLTVTAGDIYTVSYNSSAVFGYTADGLNMIPSDYPTSPLTAVASVYNNIGTFPTTDDGIVAFFVDVVYSGPGAGLRGATGSAGPTGATGATGPAGPTGPGRTAGSTRSDWSDRRNRSSGRYRPQGATGPQGPQGPGSVVYSLSGGTYSGSAPAGTFTYTSGATPADPTYTGSFPPAPASWRLRHDQVRLAVGGIVCWNNHQPRNVRHHGGDGRHAASLRHHHVSASRDLNSHSNGV